MKTMTTDPSLALLQDISQSGLSEPFDQLDGTLTADGSVDGKEISWQTFTSSNSPHGDMAVDSRSKGAIDLEGEEVSYLSFKNKSVPHSGPTQEIVTVDSKSKGAIDLEEEVSYLSFKNDNAPHSGPTKEVVTVDSESKGAIDLEEEVSYNSFKNDGVPRSGPTKDIDLDQKHSDTIMPSQTLETQNSQDDHVVVGVYDEEFGQEVTVKQPQAWHFAPNRRRRLIMCYLASAILLTVVILGAVLGTQNNQSTNSSGEVDSMDTPAPNTEIAGGSFPAPGPLAPADPSSATSIAPGFPPSSATSPNSTPVALASPNGMPTIISSPNGAPIAVASPNGAPTSLTADSALMQLLFTVSGSRLFASGSPQLVAANFLANETLTNYDDAKTIQRYAILTMVASLLNGDMTSVGSTDECDWGVIVCASSGRVTELAMTGMGLSGEIPPEISSLQALTKLDLSSNAIKGVLPEEFFSLQNLKYIYLDSNQLSGTISPLIGNMIQLEALYLAQNQFNGMIPSTLPQTLRKSSQMRGRSNDAG